MTIKFKKIFTRLCTFSEKNILNKKIYINMFFGENLSFLNVYAGAFDNNKLI